MRREIGLSLVALLVLIGSGIAGSYGFKREYKKFEPYISQTLSSLLHSPSPTPEVLGSESEFETAVVTKIIDGDTIELNSGEKIRYIGIDTPETRDPRRSVECFGKEASNKNATLVLNKEVRLEKDVSERDKYGRLLRYVYVGDELINETLVRQGFATAVQFPPDVKYADRFSLAEEMAQAEKLGLWGDVCLQ